MANEIGVRPREGKRTDQRAMDEQLILFDEQIFRFLSHTDQI